MATMTAGEHSFEFALNSAASVAVHRIGADAEPVIVIDHVMTDPHALIEYAAAGPAFVGDGGAGYPGVRAPAPHGYVETLGRRLDPLVQRTFDLHDVTLVHADCSFSIVTTPPEALVPHQRIPHIDTNYPLQFAVLHYLCDGNFGGTGFYRHKASGLEAISPQQAGDYAARRDREMAASPPSQGYIGPDSQHYVQTGAFDAVFDRLLVYRSCRLHCGLIPPTMTLSPNPREGRLTVTTFMTYVRR
ncbi:MAG: DUF6445 family protein [Sphingomonadaceae bacterium]